MSKIWQIFLFEISLLNCTKVKSNLYFPALENKKSEITYAS